MKNIAKILLLAIKIQVTVLFFTLMIAYMGYNGYLLAFFSTIWLVISLLEIKQIPENVDPIMIKGRVIVYLPIEKQIKKAKEFESWRII